MQDKIPHPIQPRDQQRFYSIIRFYPSKIKKKIQQLLNQRLVKYQYDATTAAQFTQQLSKQIRQVCKSKQIPRYKLAVQVLLGQIKGQALRVASKCLWDINYDNFADAQFKNDKIFCSALVFGTYCE